jgi:hypothetical protein
MYGVDTVFRWLHSGIVDDLQTAATGSNQHKISVKILTGGSAGDELIPNTELSRNSCLHEAVNVWLTGMLESAAQQTALSTLRDERATSLTLELTKEQIAQIVDRVRGF